MEAGRCNCFSKDDSILTGSATPDDYANSGFDKGHLSPSEDNQISVANNRESFLMSNMSPQLHRFNNGKWKELETWVRDKAMEFDTIYVVSGPVFLNNLGTIGTDSVTIPGYFYKIVLRFENGSPKMLAFLNSTGSRDRATKRLHSSGKCPGSQSQELIFSRLFLIQLKTELSLQKVLAQWGL